MRVSGGVFPYAKEEGLPIEAKGEQAHAVWKNDPPVYLEATVGYRGSKPRANYSTRLWARLRITGKLDLLLEEVEHEIR
jgi:hypothetical protein